MIPLIIFIALALFVLIATELHERRKKRAPKATTVPTPTEGECCGMHLVCEKETLLQSDAKPEYYDDEELDELAGINPANYTQEQHEAIRQVFNTLPENDVPGWCRSLQLRQIELPDDIREEALMIVRERRAIAAR
jgi:hypothetical protein